MPDVAPKITLYSIPVSHPAYCARMMLEYKGITYRRIDLINGVHAAMLRALGFPGTTIPALKIDGRRIQGSREISRELDRIRPDPPLFPSDPERRRAVEEAERWGEQVLQDIPRRLAIAAFKRDRSGLAGFLEDAKPVVPVPPRLAPAMSRPLVWIQDRRHHASDASARAALAVLPEVLDHVEALLTEGVIGSERPNAADFQIATSVRLLALFEDLREAIEGRPAGEYARQIVPRYPGRFARVFPADWLAPLYPTVAPAR